MDQVESFISTGRDIGRFYTRGRIMRLDELLCVVQVAQQKIVRLDG